MASYSGGILGMLGFVKSPGAPVPHRKSTKDMETVDMPAPAVVTIPMSMHIGAPCTPKVKPGDQVFVGQLIGDSDAFVSAPIHSSVSGTVKKVDAMLSFGGTYTPCIVIESDGKQTPDPSICPPKVKSEEDLIKALRDSGLVGLGGAGFPAHVKLNPAADVKKKIDTLIINGAECEPYLTADVREMLEDSWDIISGIQTVSKLLDVDETIIGIEDNKPEAITVIQELAEKNDGITIRVKELPARYPQGAEKVLIKQCTGREVPPGKLPADVGVIVMNVTSVGFLARYLKTGMPLTTKRVTVDGSAVAEPKNVRVCIGTPVKDVIAFCGGYKGEPSKLLYGGPMMGTPIYSDEQPILKNTNGILAFDRAEAQSLEPSACIRCGRCVNACPMNLMPTMFEKYTAAEKIDELKRLNIMTCMECGCCAYVCPANRRLVQSIRIGKTLVRNSGK